MLIVPHLHRTGIPLSLALLLVADVSAQQLDTGGLRLSMQSFLYARYATSSSSSLYVGYTLGPAALVLGAVVNPRTGYRELIGGGVSRAMWGRQSITVAFAAADATESKYLQGYLLPSFALGRVAISGTLELYEPLESGGTRQFDLNPGTVLLRVTDRVALGGCYALGLTSGSASRHRAGPVLQLAIPRGALTPARCGAVQVRGADVHRSSVLRQLTGPVPG